jgi:PAS domain S-box-containing protein
MVTGMHSSNIHGEQGSLERNIPTTTLEGRVIMLAATQDLSLRAALEKAGLQVDCVLQLSELLPCWYSKAAPVAIIIEDEFLHEGKELANTLQALQTKGLRITSVIYLASSQDVISRLQAYRAGVTICLPKPVNTDYLLQLITESLPLSPAQPYRVFLLANASTQRQHLADLLQRAGMEVRLGDDSLQLLEQLGNFAADVLVLGIDLAECGCPELVRVLQDDPRYTALPIVFLSAEFELLMQLRLGKTSQNELPPVLQNNLVIAEISKQARHYRAILEQDEALRAARYAQARQQQALDAHAIVSVADRLGKIVSVNDKFCQISGYSREELIGQNHRIIKSGIHPAAFYEEMWHTISTGHIWHGEVCNRTKNGNLYWVATSITPFNDAEGLPNHYISIRTDVTEIKENERRLRLSQDYANLGNWDWNIKTGEVEMSTGMETKFFGRPPSMLVHTYEDFLNVVHPEDVKAVMNAINECINLGVSFDVEHRCLWPDGSIHWLLERGDVLRANDGSPLHMLGVMQDITQRKQTELALVLSNTRLKEAQATAKLGNWEANIESGELFWSDEIFHIFGQDEKRFTPTVADFLSAVHPDDLALVRESKLRAMATGKHDVVHRIIRPDGTLRYVHELAHSHLNDEGRLMRLSGTVQDVTELKQAEQAMQQAKEMAEAANRAKSEFLASMSHELRTPLNAILGFSQLFILDEQLPQSTRDNSVHIEHAGQHLLSLVNDLIDLERIEANKLELSLEAVNVKTVLNDMLSIVQAIADKHSIKIVLGQGVTLDFTVWADFNRLRQALLNLLSNAIKYSKPQDVVRLDCRVIAGRGRIVVSDSGPGIPAGMQHRIFNPFDRLGKERGEVEGTGIGLVITKRMVEAMGGSIDFKSIEGQGSSFWLDLPLSTKNISAEHTLLTEQHPMNQPAAPQLNKTSKAMVLYIEDNPMNTRLMQHVFSSKKHWELSTATTAETGLEMARARPPQVILLDINLPGMDGYQALSLLRSYPETAAIPVIALTANAMVGERERGLAAGFADYLTKPLDILKLLGLLGQLLDK